MAPPETFRSPQTTGAAAIMNDLLVARVFVGSGRAGSSAVIEISPSALANFAIADYSAGILMVLKLGASHHCGPVPSTAGNSTTVRATGLAPAWKGEPIIGLTAPRLGLSVWKTLILFDVAFGTNKLPLK